MNYFELHIGDLTEATAHLSILEDGAYGRLMRKYYATEKPLPADVGQVQRLIGARSREEKAAVEVVLAEFFELQDDGWHQSRCDAEIAAFHAKQTDREGAKENAKERQRRARERRKALFDELRRHGMVPSYTTTTAELETLLSRVTEVDPSRVTPGYQSRDVTPPVTRDATATQTPDTKHQTPEEEKEPPASRAPPQKPSVRGSRLPADWDPGEDGRSFAGAQGLRNGRGSAELAKFRDYWTAQPGQKGVRADWPATWRNWVRKATEGPSPKGGAPASDLDEMFRRGAT